MMRLLEDLRLALRRMRHQPGFSTVVVLTLALGIGANTAMYTLIRALMEQSLPIDQPEGLYRLGDEPNCCVNSGLQTTYSLFSYAFYRHAQTTLTEFSSLAAFQASATALSMRAPGAAPALSVNGEFVSANYFRTLGVRAAAGRLLQPDDDRPGATPALVISHRLWNEAFAGDPSVVGTTVTLGGVSMTIAGVTAEGFFGDTMRPDPPDAWLPLGQEPVLRGGTSLTSRPDQDWLYIVGRLVPGATAAGATAHATSTIRQWLAAQSFVDEYHVRDQIAGQSISVVPAPAGVQVLKQTFGQPLVVLLAMSGLVLLIAAANLANLLLSRANLGEAALRSALGASAVRLVRQSLTEGVLLALVGGVAALVVGQAATRAMVALAFPGASYLPVATGPSASVLIFALTLAVLTGLLFTAAPAWAASRAHPVDALRGVGRSGGDRAFVPRRSLVVVQVALSIVLLTGAGLLGRSLRALETQPLGFDPDRRYVVFINPPAADTPVDRLAENYTALAGRIGRIPGVERVTYSLYSPMEGNNWSSQIAVEGRPVDPAKPDGASWNRVGPGYFETLGTRVLKGRDIRESDTPTSERVAVVNQAFARQFLPDVDPLTRHAGIGDASHAGDYRIVGVVDDVKYSGAARPARPMIFLPAFQQVTYADSSNGGVQARSMLLRTLQFSVAPGAGQSPEPAVRRAVAEVDPDLTILRVRKMADQVSINFRMNRLMSDLTAAYGVLALALASLGLYGVTAYGVARRRREIGVRIALGADRTRVVGDVIRGALVHTLIGVAIGVPTALAGASAISALLYGVAPHDPAIVIFAAGALIASAAVAAFLPARSASAVSPMEALRGD